MNKIYFILPLLTFLISISVCNAQNTDDLIPVCLDGKWGYIDTNGVMVIEPQFDFSPMEESSEFSFIMRQEEATDDTSEFVVSISENGKYGFADRKTGKTVIKHQFDYAGWFNDKGFANIKKDGKWGIINTKGEFVLEPIYDYISHSDNCELICVEQNGKSRLINLRGETIADLESEPRQLKELIQTALALMVRDNNLPIPIKKGDNKFDFIDINGKTVFSGKFDDVWIFYKGTAKFTKNGKWGVIDSTGKIIAKPRYDQLENMDDFYIAKLGDKYGVVDFKGNVVLEPQFKKIDPHMEDGKYIKAIGEDGFGLYDTTGKMIIEPNYYNIKVKGNRIFVKYTENFSYFSVGMYNLKGECIVEPKFDAVYEYNFFSRWY